MCTKREREKIRERDKGICIGFQFQLREYLKSSHKNKISRQDDFWARFRFERRRENVIFFYPLQCLTTFLTLLWYTSLVLFFACAGVQIKWKKIRPSRTWRELKKSCFPFIPCTFQVVFPIGKEEMRCRREFLLHFLFLSCNTIAQQELKQK